MTGKKYLKGEDVILWLHGEKYKFTAPSNFWRRFMDTMPVSKKWLVWLVGNGAWVLIGLLTTLIQHLKVL